MSYYIKGESGKAIGATLQLLTSLNFDSTSLTLSSMDDDVLEWTASTINATGTGTTLPSNGQVIELYNGSTRIFKGHAIKSSMGMKSVKVEVKGPWWWMEQIMISSPQTDQTGVTKTRPSYVFPTQNVRTSLISLVNLMIADGVPIQLGTIDTMYSFPRITLAETSYASAITELLSTHPDAVLWFDYSGTGYPKLMISRRGAMSTYTLDLSNQSDGVCDVNLWPRIELEVKRVDLVSTSRRATDKFLQFESSGSGTATIAKNQTIVISGEAVNNGFLPKDLFNSFNVKTYPCPGVNSGVAALTQTGKTTVTYLNNDLTTWINANDPTLATIKRDYGFSAAISAAGEISTYYIALNGGHAADGSVLKPLGDMSWFLGNPTVTSKSSTTGMHVIISLDRVPEWANSENGYTLADGSLKAFAVYQAATGSPNTYPSWWADLSKKAQSTFEGYPGGQVNYDKDFFCGCIFEVSIPVKLISAPFTVLTTLYRKSDYDYITPPAGMAAGLLAAQNWVPWEGSLQQVSDAPTGSQLLGYNFNLLNGFSDCASMKALARSIVYDFGNGRTTINIGPPRRTDFKGLANKFRRSPSDNIIYL